MKQEKTIRILGLLNEGILPIRISQLLKIKKSNLSRKMKEMSIEGLIKKHKGIYDLTGKGKLFLIRAKKSKVITSSLGVSDIGFFRDKTRFHDLKVKFNIIKRGEALDTEKIQINNWAKEIAHINIPIPITLEITTQSAILHFHAKEIPNDSNLISESFKWVYVGCEATRTHLAQYGWKLDGFSFEVIHQHIATKTADSVDNKVPKHIVIEKGLNRKASSFSGEMKIEAKAWMDRSKGKLEVETNDLTYEEKILMMPEFVYNTENNAKELRNALYLLKDYNKNLKLHISVMKNINKFIKQNTKEKERIK